MTETAAYSIPSQHDLRASALTGGPWSPEPPHAWPPTALIARAVGRVAEWIRLDAKSGIGGGLAELTLYDEAGLIGRAMRSLTARARA